jgi:alkanesulfonate monooxygenase SsuD/methylene tetrahydromethanopterin reductase-like flavin-dependent oxidoreductase (luciferase family)
MMDAIAIYRQRFRASAQLQKPHVMLGFNVFAADSDEQARLLATSMQQAFVNLRTGQPTQLPPPVAGYLEQLPGSAQAMLAEVLSCSAIGAPATVAGAARDFLRRTGADELMLTCQMFDHAARLRSFEIAATCLRNLPAPH